MKLAYKNLQSSETIIPGLAIAVKSSIAVDLDVLAAPFPKRDRFLERVPEVVALPVLNVIRELVALACSSQLFTKRKLTLIVPSRFT